MTLRWLLCSDVKKMGSEFVLGYIQAMDGEKDPRNLVVVLNSVHRIVLHLPFGECNVTKLALARVLCVFVYRCVGRGPI